MKNFWHDLYILLKPFHRKMGFLTILIIVFEAAKLVSPYLLKLIIDGLVNWEPDDVQLIFTYVGLMFVADLFLSLVNRGTDRYIFWLLIAMENYLPVKLHKKLVSLSLDYHERESTGNVITKIQRGSDRLVELTSNFSWGLLPTVFQVILTGIAIAVLEWRLALVFVVAVPIFLYLTIKMSRELYPLRKKRHQAYEDSSGLMAQSIFNIYTVQSFAQEKEETRRFKNIRDDLSENSRKEFGRRITYNFWRGLIIDSGRVAVLLYGVFLVWKGIISIGTLIFFTTLSEKAYSSLFNFSRVYDLITDSSTAVERIMKLLGEERLIKNSAHPVVPKKIKGEIEFRDVNFCYQSSKERLILKDLSFTVPAGNKVALVGPSGGGKTTIVKLIYRHYDVSSGAILVDGTDIKQFDLESYRQKLAIVPQEAEIFNTTVARNIAYGQPEATLAEIKRASKIAHADEFINQFKNGYETLVGERGVRLSGGQKQRLGIARAVLIDPKILIFDEATSHLDAISERLIQSALEELAKNRTTIIIAHRLSTIKSADKILVIEDGSLKEQGKHEDLEKNSGLYADLLKLQSLGQVRK